MKDDKVENLGKESPTFADEVIKAQQEAVKIKAVKQELGLDESHEPKESLATSIVTKSMEQTDAAIRRMHEESERLYQRLLDAQTAREQASTALYNERLANLQQAEKRATQAAQGAAQAGAPKSAFDYYREVKEELGKFLEQSQPSPRPEGISDQTAITLKKLELDQARILEQMRMDSERQRREWDLKLLEFRDESKRRWSEYSDQKEFRQQGLAGLEDIIGSIGAGIRKDMGTQPPEEEVESSSQPPTKGGKFLCEMCGTEITVKPGQEVAKCPNPQCGTMYHIKE